MKSQRRNTILIGSYRKDPARLVQVFDALKKENQVLIPKSINFTNLNDDFVKTEEEKDKSPHEIELDVLNAIRKSDFVWLFAPEGYVGLSAAFELGYAQSIGVPVYTDSEVNDPLLKSMITAVIASPAVVPDVIYQPGKGLEGLQDYYTKAAARRGWSNESPQDSLLLLTEELGELARAIRKQSGLKRDGAYAQGGIAEELADIQLYLVHLANGLHISLAEAVSEKEKENERRFRQRNTTQA